GGGADHLAEAHVLVPGRQRRVPGLVVVARVVEEIDAGLARGPHDADALVAADPLVGTPGPERQPAHLQVAAAQGGHWHGGRTHAASVTVMRGAARLPRVPPPRPRPPASRPPRRSSG